MFASKIIITDDFDGIKAELLKQLHPDSLRFIPKEVASEFLIDDTKAIEKESYIAGTSEKVIVLVASSFRIEAQNSLLKLLGEPPKNIKFLIVIPSKNLLLPTIESRPICEKCNKIEAKNTLNLELNKMDLKALFGFLQKSESLDKTELMEKIALIVEESVRFKDFNADELEFFYESYEPVKLNSKNSSVLATLLLNYYTKDEK